MTKAYKQKLEEDKKWLEEEAIREKKETQEDVRKRGHMGDFYRQTFPPLMNRESWYHRQAFVHISFEQHLLQYPLPNLKVSCTFNPIHSFAGIC